MTDPDQFEVSYQINPWMKPDAWRNDPEAQRAAAKRASAELASKLSSLGAEIETIAPVSGLPDLVFPANAAIVIDRRVLLARFRHSERRGEEAVFRAAFESLRQRGLLDSIFEFPSDVFQEGAGDCIWDADRSHFWVGHGPRSSWASMSTIEGVFGQEAVPLELTSEYFYHLDTCFCVLTGGYVLYYPAALSEASLNEVHRRVPENLRIEADSIEAMSFCVNAVSIGENVVMAKAPDTLRSKLESRGFAISEIDLAPFILSGGASYCMTLRLDLQSVGPSGSSTNE